MVPRPPSAVPGTTVPPAGSRRCRPWSSREQRNHQRRRSAIRCQQQAEGQRRVLRQARRAAATGRRLPTGRDRPPGSRRCTARGRRKVEAAEHPVNRAAPSRNSARANGLTTAYCSPLRTAAVAVEQQQRIGRDQQHLEADEQVEQVGRQEGGVSLRPGTATTRGSAVRAQSVHRRRRTDERSRPRRSPATTSRRAGRPRARYQAQTQLPGEVGRARCHQRMRTGKPQRRR